jgi:hypothetical protein
VERGRAGRGGLERLAHSHVGLVVVRDEREIRARQPVALRAVRPRGVLLEHDGERPVDAEARDRDLERLLQERHAVGRLPLEERHVRVEAPVEGDERAREDEQDPHVGGQEADVVLGPGIAADHHREDVQAQQGEEEGEPGCLVDVPLDRWSAVPHLVEGGVAADGGERDHHDDGEAEGREDRQDARARGLVTHGRPKIILGAALGRSQ